MYKCRDCHEYFTDPNEYEDKVECWGHNTSMYSYTCPYCDSDDFDEASVVDEEDKGDDR